MGADDRVELIDGEIVEMSPINVPRSACVDMLGMHLSRRVPEGIIVMTPHGVNASSFYGFAPMHTHPYAIKVAL